MTTLPSYFFPPVTVLLPPTITLGEHTLTHSNNSNRWVVVKLSECITQTIRLVEWTDAGMGADNGANDRG